MSDAARQKLKVSREGIVLIKSFEGFRPRAIQRAEGGWIIGYGHTLSAREGATVSEADAELLLRYDLLPVEVSVNAAGPTELNQHQFDALVSFAFSVGVDRFASSDVRQCLAAGAPGEAADAIMGWPEPALPDTALRRRAAERALFVANPAVPVALSDLLGAPLPPPPVPAPPVPVQAGETEIEPVAPVEPMAAAPVSAEPEPETAAVAPVDPRGAAVAALLGEPAVRLVQDQAPGAPIIPSFAPSPDATGTLEQPAPSNDNPTGDVVVEVDSPTEASTTGTPPPPGVVEPEPEPVEASPNGAARADPVVDAAPDTASWSAARYAPYSLAMVGPLPDLRPATVHADSVSPLMGQSVIEVSPAQVDESPVDESPADESTVDAAVETRAEAEGVETVEPEVAATEPHEPAPVEIVAVEPDLPAPVEPMAYVTPVAAAPAAELVLTPLEDAPEPAFVRPLWTAEERDAPDGSENNLFGEDLTLTLGGSVMRHEIEAEAPVRFDWKETAPFIFMGGVGLVSFGASMAAFRRAAEQSGGSELTIIGWVLALIGLGCVGVSSINLYRKFGLPGGD